LRNDTDESTISIVRGCRVMTVGSLGSSPVPPIARKRWK
jgi:hypothetical protein